MRRFASLAACVALAAPSALYAQTADEADGEVNLDAIDALLGDQEVTGDDDADTAEEETEDADEASEDEDAEDGSEEAATNEEDAPEPSDLTVAFNAYSLCSSEAGAALEEQGFALDQIGEEALLRCSGQRAAYVNAFYFSLLPRYPDAPEATVRASAERLVAQSDTALAALVTGEVTVLRAEREAEAETETAEDAEPSEDDDSADEATEEETETDA
ncbi:hypothetical protein [Parasphingopyxis sp.]|uniref:hypothetical protein n=1 Tax=Parasphingopyxis sp. TaxID=1920299 RepID=UPI00263416A1|nr:hypothetical protein [Parasphingopyxis sp.]